MRLKFRVLVAAVLVAALAAPVVAPAACGRCRLRIRTPTFNEVSGMAGSPQMGGPD